MDKGIEALIAHMKWRIKDAAQDGHNMIGVKSDELAELIAALEQAQQRNGQLSAERDALRESGLNGQANTRAAADIYFQLIEECDIQPGGSLVQHIDGMRDRIAEFNAAPNGMMQLSNELAEMLVEKLPAPMNVKMGGDAKTKAMFSGMSMMLEDCKKVIRAAGGTVAGGE